MEKRRGTKSAIARTLAAAVFLHFSSLNSGFALVPLGTASHGEQIPFFTLLLSQFFPSYRNFFSPSVSSDSPFLKQVHAGLSSAFGQGPSTELRDLPTELTLAVLPSAARLILGSSSPSPSLVSAARGIISGLFKRLNRQEIARPPTSTEREGPSLTSLRKETTYHSPPRTELSPPKRSPFLRPKVGYRGISRQITILDGGGGNSLFVAAGLLHEAGPPPGAGISIWTKVLLRKMLRTGSGFGNRDGGDFMLELLPDLTAPNFEGKIGRFSFSSPASTLSYLKIFSLSVVTKSDILGGRL